MKKQRLKKFLTLWMSVTMAFSLMSNAAIVLGAERGDLLCGLEESEGHTHTGECYETRMQLICGQEENEEHQHTEECYEEVSSLICGQAESPGHTHTDACYARGNDDETGNDGVSGTGSGFGEDNAGGQSSADGIDGASSQNSGAGNDSAGGQSDADGTGGSDDTNGNLGEDDEFIEGEELNNVSETARNLKNAINQFLKLYDFGNEYTKEELAALKAQHDHITKAYEALSPTEQEFITNYAEFSNLSFDDSAYSDKKDTDTVPPVEQEKKGDLLCGLEENEEHTHTDACYSQDSKQKPEETIAPVLPSAPDEEEPEAVRELKNAIEQFLNAYDTEREYSEEELEALGAQYESIIEAYAALSPAEQELVTNYPAFSSLFDNSITHINEDTAAAASVDGQGYSTLQEAYDAAKGAGADTIVLQADIDLDTYFQIPTKITIDFNGHVINAAAGYPAFYVYGQGDLTLAGTGAVNGSSFDYGGVIYITSDNNSNAAGTVTLKDNVTLQSGTSSYGGARCV